MSAPLHKQPTRAELALHLSGAAANLAAISAVQRCIKSHPDIDKDMVKFIDGHLTGWFGSLHSDNLASRNPTIQIDGEFVWTHPAKTLTVTVTFDVDIPLVDSNQMPHIGWEVQVNGVKVKRGQDVWGPDRDTKLLRQDDSGHCYVGEGVLRVGRPTIEARKKLAKTTAGGTELTDGTKVYKLTVTSYKIPDDK
ncbi:hypothetical protein DFP73DRAFT_636685 [Morchella snyderi]|nr:hypothetical protein DFP73DRAFT_636685 [Morchella snyderi]